VRFKTGMRDALMKNFKLLTLVISICLCPAAAAAQYVAVEPVEMPAAATDTPAVEVASSTIEITPVEIEIIEVPIRSTATFTVSEEKAAEPVTDEAAEPAETVSVSSEATVEFDEGQQAEEADETVEIREEASVSFEEPGTAAGAEEPETVEITSEAAVEFGEAAEETETPAGEEITAEPPGETILPPIGLPKTESASDVVEGAKDPFGLLQPDMPKPGVASATAATAATVAPVIIATGAQPFSTGAFDFESVFGDDKDTGPKTVSIQNDFIKVVVNTMDVDTGRFLAETVLGDPGSKTDDNKILIYGGAIPWTSFTTIRIDGENYIFGGPTMRRPGRNALTGKVVQEPAVVDEKTITTKCEIAGLDVTQSLSIVGGPISNRFDTIRINTAVRNPGLDPRRVGVRLVIDTLLGSNDGSPFKVGAQSITSETEMRGMDIQDYWIAFDSLEDPGVVARGTLRGPGLTTPDRVVFANWGKLADNIWDIPFNPGQDFRREAENEMDSATALYWDETTIMPDGELQYTTLYGIDYLNVAGDVLSMGANRKLGQWSTARNQIRTYTLYAYVANSSSIDLHDVEISLDLPDGIEYAGGGTDVRRLGYLPPGKEETVGWELRPRAGAGGDRVIRVVGRAKEVDGVELETGVVLLPPPEVMVEITAPGSIEKSEDRTFGPYGPPFPIKVKCFNDGKYHIDNLNVKLILPEGLRFPRVQRAVQTVSRLDGQDTIVFEWRVNATGEAGGPLEYRILVESDTTEPKTVERTIDVEPLNVTAIWRGVPEKTTAGMFITAELFLRDVPEIGRAEFSVKYNTEVLDVVRVSQGTLFVQNDQPLPWKDPRINEDEGLVADIVGKRETPLEISEGSLVLIHFIAKKPGQSTLELLNPRIYDLEGDPVEFNYVPAVINVEEAGE